MADSDIRIRTTHDGTQAEASIRRLETSVSKLGDTVGNKLKSAVMGAFSVEKILQFARFVDATVEKAAALADKLKEGKATLEDIDKSGISRENVGFASEAKAFKERARGPVENMTITALRTALGLFAYGSAGGWMAQGASPSFRLLAATAVTPQSRRTERMFEAGQAERDRQYAIEDIVRREMDDNGDAVRSYLTGGRGIVGMSSLEDYRNALLKEQVDQLKEINRKLNPRASTLLERKSMFE